VQPKAAASGFSRKTQLKNGFLIAHRYAGAVIDDDHRVSLHVQADNPRLCAVL
jgi:hypothetical protein